MFHQSSYQRVPCAANANGDPRDFYDSLDDFEDDYEEDDEVNDLLGTRGYAAKEAAAALSPPFANSSYAAASSSSSAFRFAGGGTSNGFMGFSPKFRKKSYPTPEEIGEHVNIYYYLFWLSYLKSTHF